MKLFNRVMLLMSLLVLGMGFTGCVRTTIHTHTVPDLPAKTFHKIAIDFTGPIHFDAVDAEDALAAYYNERSIVKSTPMEDILKGDMEPQDKEIYSKLNELGFDGYLVVELKGENVRFGRGHTGVSINGIEIHEGDVKALYYDVQLKDVQTRQCYWNVTVEVKTSLEYPEQFTFNSIGKQTLKNLVQQGLIIPAKG